MPPKKKVSLGETGDAATTVKASAEADGLGVEDLGLPRSIVQRIAKGVLPANTQVAKDAVLAMSKSATVFVNYLTAEAGEAALRRGTKRIYPQDVISAIHDIEFGGFEGRLQAELAKYQEKEDDKRKQRNAKGVGAPKESGTADWDADGEHLAKRARTEGDSAGLDGTAMALDGDDGDETVSDHENDEELEDDEDEPEDEEDEPETQNEAEADGLENGRNEETDEALEENDSD